MEDDIPVEPEVRSNSKSAVTFPLKVGKEQLAVAQKLDPSLVKCIDAAVSFTHVSNAMVAYFWEDTVLMCRWRRESHEDLQQFLQIALPAALLTVWVRRPNLSQEHEYILTIMCTATRFQEAIPLC